MVVPWVIEPVVLVVIAHQQQAVLVAFPCKIRAVGQQPVVPLLRHRGEIQRGPEDHRHPGVKVQMCIRDSPMTVPFIMALGVGVAAIRSDRHAADDSFGLVALCSVGPILAVLILGIAFQASDSTYIPPILPEAVSYTHLQVAGDELQALNGLLQILGSLISLSLIHI